MPIEKNCRHSKLNSPKTVWYFSLLLSFYWPQEHVPEAPFLRSWDFRIFWITASTSTLKCSAADPDWFIPDLDPALNFLSSGSGSNPYYLSIFGNYEKQQIVGKAFFLLNLVFYFMLQSYSTDSPEFTGLKWELILLFICSFIFCWIHADPDPHSATLLELAELYLFVCTHLVYCIVYTVLLGGDLTARPEIQR